MKALSRKETNRLSLLDEGVRIMTAQGYHGTGVKELVESVGVPKGSFYQYFDSKEHFCALSVKHYIDPYITSLRQHVENGPGDALSALRAYFKEQTSEAATRDFQGGCLLGNLLGEVGESHGACYEALKSAVDRYCKEIQNAFELAQSEGTIVQSTDAKEMSNTLFCAWQGALLRMKVERSTWPLDACLKTLLDEKYSR
jgi:TetR/AcrR family transcriptional repressor of nem operon